MSHSLRHLLFVFLLFVVTAPSYSQTKVVKLTTIDWEPYIGQSLPDNGYVYELVETAFKKSGYQIRVLFVPWARALLMAQRGEVDAVFPEYYSSAREKEFVFSDPFLGGPVGFYKRKDSLIEYQVDPRVNQEAALLALSGYKFGVVRGYLNTDTFDRADFLLKEDVVDDFTNLKRLYHNRIQLIFIDKFVAEYLLTRKMPDYVNQLEFMEPPLEIKHLYLAFSTKAPDYEKKRQAFNHGLKLTTQDGTLQRIYAKHGFTEVLWYQQQINNTKSVMPK